MTTDEHVTQMEHIYKSMLAKALINIKKSQVTQQKYYNVRTCNNPFSMGDKFLKKNMADESHNAEM